MVYASHNMCAPSTHFRKAMDSILYVEIYAVAACGLHCGLVVRNFYYISSLSAQYFSRGIERWWASQSVKVALSRQRG
jgi:hypothetical protein